MAASVRLRLDTIPGTDPISLSYTVIHLSLRAATAERVVDTSIDAMLGVGVGRAQIVCIVGKWSSGNAP